jgi:hypothetical protein
MAPSHDRHAMTTRLAPRGATIEPFHAGEIGMRAMARLRPRYPAYRTALKALGRIDFDPIRGHRHMRFSFAVTGEEVERALAMLGPWLARQPRLR